MGGEGERGEERDEGGERREQRREGRVETRIYLLILLKMYSFEHFQVNSFEQVLMCDGFLATVGVIEVFNSAGVRFTNIWLN